MNKKEFKECLKIFKNQLKEAQFSFEPFKFEQHKALNSILIKGQDDLMDSNAFFIPSNTLSASFPFNNNYLLDPNTGFYLGKNNTNGLMFWDQFAISHNRINHNVIILGKSGVGKTFLTTRILNYHVMLNRQVIVIDFEKDYEKICHFYHGNFIDVINTKSFKINPLQVLINDDESQNPISQHLFFLEKFFQILAPDLLADELRYLIQATSLLYDKFGINVENVLKLKNEDFPILNDLLKIIQTNKELKNDESYRKIYKLLSIELTNNGLYDKIYNCHTTANLASNLTVFSFANLKRDNEKLLYSLEFLMLNFINNLVEQNATNKNNKIVICIDEAHLMINHKNLIALDFIHGMFKRIRKKHGGMIITTQNPDDFVATEDVRSRTMGIINNCQYFFILGLSSKNINDVDNMFQTYGGLSDMEKDFLSRAKRGEAFFLNSNYDRYFIVIDSNIADNNVIELHSSKIK